MLLNELSEKSFCRAPPRLDNKGQNYIAAFRHPVNGHFYISLNMNTFNEYDNCCLGFLYYCYILYSSLLSE